MGADCALLVSCYASLKVSCHALIKVTLHLKASHLPLPISYFLTSNKGNNHPSATTEQHPRHCNNISQFSHVSFPTTIIQREKPDCIMSLMLIVEGLAPEPPSSFGDVHSAPII